MGAGGGGAGGPATPGKGLLGEDSVRSSRHGGDIHDAEREQDDEQEPATAEAISTMQQSHAQRARSTVAPRYHDEGDRRAALREAQVLQRRELVEPRRDEHSPADSGRGGRR